MSIIRSSHISFSVPMVVFVALEDHVFIQEVEQESGRCLTLRRPLH
jgi:hypothetical protein